LRISKSTNIQRGRLESSQAIADERTENRDDLEEDLIEDDDQVRHYKSRM
jgi:hypothetical protein